MSFYTYAHYTADTKELFYIGKGQKNRHKHSCSKTRNKWWHSKVKKHNGFVSEILAVWDTEKEAFEHEKFLISIFKKQLVNLTDGGEGCAGLVHSTEARNKRSKSLMGKALTEERKTNISKSLQGRKLSTEHAQRSREILSALREKTKVKVKCIETEEIFDSVSEAALQTGVDASSIVKACKQKLNTAGGKRWAYV